MMKRYRFTVNATDFETEIVSVEGQNVTLEINGTPYEIKIHREQKESKTPALVRSSVPDPKKKIEVKQGGARVMIKSPLPGIITKIYVKQGDKVSKNQKLYSLEAMKMENEIKAEREGTVSAVKVTVGQSVLQEDIVLELD